MTNLPDLEQLSEEDLLLLEELLGDEYPVTAAQADMIDCAAAHPDSRAAGIHLAMRVEGGVSVERLRAAHDAMWDRHAAFRTTFRHTGDGWVQGVATGGTFPFTLRTAETFDDHLVRRVLNKHQREGFDLLGGGALARAELVLTRDGTHLQVWSFHHAVVDGYSLGLIWDDFTAHYNGLPHASAPASFGEYALWQREWLHGAEANGQQQRLLALAEPAVSPCTVRRPNPSIGSVDVAVPPDVHEAVARLGAASATTTHMVLLAAYRHSVAAEGFLDASAPVWTPLAGRTDARFASTVGMFANAVPVFGGAAPASTVAGSLEEVKNGCITAMECQSVPQRELPDVPVQALFALQNTSSGSGALSGSTTTVVRPDGVPQVAPILEFYSPADRMFRTALSFGYRGGGLAGVLEHDRAVVPDEAARLIAARFSETVALFASGTVPW
ncbi:condensation domain-containing protein [Amycolatopsis sp. NPDC004079]|uniref:condensation domain-containing protein n=1 Tax=Amycolatopsis sp. NPDC004079 TaxID=3154549 RepID=UPI0033AFE303